MPRIESGSSTTNQANVNAVFSLNVSQPPQAGGHYSIGWETTSLAFTNNVVVWDFRNPSANLVLVNFVEAHINQMAIAAASLTGLRATLQLFVGRSYTVLSNTGRTALTLTTNNCKLRTSYPTSSMEIGIASATGGITAGTITEDASALATSTSTEQSPSVTAAAAPGANQHRADSKPLIWKPQPYSGPIVLAQNEGIRIRYLVTTAAAVIISGQTTWSELQSTVYP